MEFQLTLRKTVEAEVFSLQHWINAYKLTISLHPNKSCFSVFKPLNRGLHDKSKNVLFILESY